MVAAVVERVRGGQVEVDASAWCGDSILYNKLLTSKYIFLNKLKILIHKLTIISEKFVIDFILFVSIYQHRFYVTHCNIA